ncbi:M4 family metallopeptidase [Paenibacillus sp. BSR1-1]|uniref:M4 family metallopeptidase n=1 Tax=Paenibacillus sp. BSR1-1 TaxID=3020845 RepID=UPI0025B1C4EF|nr:M4 family metallopeptidase [Paenibacillus sp. BSR1-1]MDN3018286.1 M4 family metallopeptidase [Paenibacillus sp. BSR1-1]
MKKRTSLVLALGLTVGAVLPITAAAQTQSAVPYNVMVKKDAAQFGKEAKVNWKKGQTVPSFVHGKLSTKALIDKAAVKQFLKENKELYQLDSDKDLTLLDVQKDELGTTHYNFVQSVQGIPVDGAKFKVHTDKNGIVTAVNGDVFPEASSYFKGALKAQLSKADALDKAWKSINLTKKDTLTNAEVDPTGKKVEDTAEKAELVVYKKANDFYLAYKTNLQFIQPYGANWVVYVDAINGNILDSYNAVADGATTGSGYGVLGDYKTFNTYFSNSTYYLYDVTKPMTGVIETRTAQNRTLLPGNYSVDPDNQFNAVSQGADVDANYYAGKVYDYYKNTFNRNSFDNNGATIRSSVHYSRNYNNAFWNGQQMVYGDGDGVQFRPLSGALDVVGHELTHAVTERTAGLDYINQSGALNESISDTFGVFMDKGDYLIGEDVYTPQKSGDALRSLSNPTLYGQPDNMSNYVNTTSDNGGVHTNSGIPNKAAYLTINSLGTSVAEKIYYRALTVYLAPQSNFSDARAALLASAADLYGSGSTQYSAVASAWSQVGVN